ncbi:MAG: chemotaxis protein CheA [Desulfobulbaceae bacterium]|nr:chemotaxis protein CheA [Desulfobulbaceae bacterium]
MAETDFFAVFQEEAMELLEDLEGALLELEESPGDLKLVGKVFRSMHTIKGSAAMFGFDRIADFTHHVETVLDRVRDGAVPVSSELISLVLESRDFIKMLLDAASGGDEPDTERGNSIINELALLTSGEGETKDAEPVPEEEAEAEKKTVSTDSEDTASLQHYLIDFCPQPAFFEEGGDIEQILKDIDALGEVTFLREGPRNKESLDRPDWKILVSAAGDFNVIRDVFIFAESSSKLEIEEQESGKSHQQIAQEIGASDTGKADGKETPPVQTAKEIPPTPKSKKTQAPEKTSKRAEFQKLKSAESIRVAADKLDSLINLVGELVVTQARLTDVATVSQQVEFMEPVEQIEHLTAELRDLVLNIRMLPIGTTFTRFKRLVRDLSAELGKEVEMVTEGEDTELDKTVIEQLNDPLIHLIRNSIDHGIEKPDIRNKSGKDSTGTLRLSATHTGANVVISIIDDGKGLDAESIRKKSIEKGILKGDEELSKQEIFDLIFAAGVSTAKEVSSVSGRGVGMDVVKSAIEKLRGSVHVDSEKGSGTTVTITLPLTLAIIDGLLVRTRDTHFVLPLSEVEECFELTGKDIARFKERRVFEVREHLIPYVRLRDFFAIPGKKPEREQMVVVRLRNEQIGLVVDDVIGGHQTVIKSLGWVYRNATGLSGSTILGNGEVALIIDTQALAKSAQLEETESCT